MPDLFDPRSAFDTLMSAPRGELVAASCYVAIAVAASLEALWLFFRGGPGRIASHLTAATMGLGGVAVGVVVSSVWVAVWVPLRSFAPDPLVATWGSEPILGAIAAFVAWDAASWIYHWVGHRSAIGWASHQVHHSGAEFDLSLAWRQSWLPLPALVVFPPLALAGFKFSTMAVCAAVSALYQALCHYAGTVRFPAPVKWLLVTPETHRRHHSSASSGAVNLGAVFTLWDRLAGTWDPRPVRVEHTELAHNPAPAGPLAIEAAGWLNLVHGAQANRICLGSASSRQR